MLLTGTALCMVLQLVDFSALFSPEEEYVPLPHSLPGRKEAVLSLFSSIC